jgi:hypothetical protein
LSYQWYVGAPGEDGFLSRNPIEGAAESTCTPATTEAGSFIYDVEIKTSSYTVRSDSAWVFVRPPAEEGEGESAVFKVTETMPRAVECYAGDKVTLMAIAEVSGISNGTGTVLYQWKRCRVTEEVMEDGTTEYRETGSVSVGGQEIKTSGEPAFLTALTGTDYIGETRYYLEAMWEGERAENGGFDEDGKPAREFEARVTVKARE